MQFYKWFNELTDRGLIPRYPGYERGAKLPPPDQVPKATLPCHVSAPACPSVFVQHSRLTCQVFICRMCIHHRPSLQDSHR